VTNLGPREIAPYWLSNGGTQGTVVVAVAVALAESGGDPAAVSPSGDYGLWQINAGHQSLAPNLWPRILEPGINADFAVHISSNGSNWRDWVTCYANIAQSGYSSFLAAPEAGSAAANYLAFVASELGRATPPGQTPPPYVPPAPVTPGRGGMESAWQAVQDWHNQHSPALLNRLHNVGYHMEDLQR
jgi:hypothetical protein